MIDDVMNGIIDEEINELNRGRKACIDSYPEFVRILPVLITALSSQPLNESRQNLWTLAYVSACNLDAERADVIHGAARFYSLIPDDVTTDDLVLFACYLRDDSVTAFRWMLHANDGKDGALRESLLTVFQYFAKHPKLELIYTELLYVLSEEYLPFEKGSESYDVRDAVATLMGRLRRYTDLMRLIESEPEPSLEYCKLWLEHKIEDEKILETKTIDRYNQTVFFWKKVAAFCTDHPDDLQQIGRLCYPMIWYLSHRQENERSFFETVLPSLLYANWRITRIKEMMNIPLALFNPENHITMYMRPGKFERTFTPREGEKDAFWSLTCSDHMNDDYEGSVFFDYMKECGVSLFDGDFCPAELRKGGERSSVFLGSVSGTFESDYMYELYASDAGKRGFCVDIDPRSFDDLLEDSAGNDEYSWICPLYFLQYANNIDEIQLLNVKMQVQKLGGSLKMIGLFVEDYKKKSPDSARSFVRVLYRMLEEIIFLFKKTNGPDNTARDEKGSPIERDWQREKEMRMMKCVRGDSPNKVESEKCDANGRHYLNYHTNKRIIVKNVYGGDTEKELAAARKRISELQKDLPN